MAPKSTRCLSCLFDATLSLRGPSNGTRAFSSTERQLFRKRYVHRRPQNAEDAALRSNLKGYNPLEKKLLKYKYNEEQMRALAAGEEAVDTKDLLQQGRFRTDPMRLEYIDDFATLRPSVDYPVDSESKPRKAVKKDEAEDNYKNAQERRAAEARKDAGLVRLSQQTGMSLDEIGKLQTKVLVTHRVVNQTRMGKIQSLYFLSVAGNGRGMVGIGEGKAAEDEDGRRQARMNAIRNMKPVPRYENRTIYGEVEAKVGASIVQLSARPPGKFSNSRLRYHYR